MDWIEQVKQDFSYLDWMQDLKKRKFIGNIKLNFYKGEVIKISKQISAYKKGGGE